LLFWDIGRSYQFGREKLKERLRKASKGTFYVRNRRRYVDEAGWMRRDDGWKTYFRTLLLDRSSASREYLDQNYIGSLIKQHEQGARDNSAKILRLATFELFLKQFMTSPNNP
jgi:hypothetical protein